MQVNSSAIVVQTPKKNESRTQSASLESIQRFCPSKHLQDGLLSISRVHDFYHSNQIGSIEEMKLSLNFRNCIRDLFTGFDQDVEDWIIRMEEKSLESKTYSIFIRDYISLEFYVQKEHSFAVLVLLNYTVKFKLAPESAFAEVFNLSIKETFCDECDTIQSSDVCKDRNLDYLKKVLIASSDLDDSDLDPDYLNVQKRNVDGFSDDSEHSPNKVQKKNLTNPSIMKQKVAEEEISVNPFLDSDSNSDSDVYDFKEAYGVNPFASSDDEVQENKATKSFNPKSMSSVSEKKSNNCHLCQKRFSSNYNLKLHLIQVHRIQVPKMTVFRCPQCDFITGSKGCFTRHKETHSGKGKNRVLRGTQVVCNICGQKCANDSSLRRHKKRRHTEDL